MGSGASAAPAPVDVLAASEEELIGLMADLGEEERFKLKAVYESVFCGGLLSAELSKDEIREFDDKQLQDHLEEAEAALIPLQEQQKTHQEYVAAQQARIDALQEATAQRRRKLQEEQKKKLVAEKKLREAKELVQSLGPYASPRYHASVSERPKITPPHNPEDWSFERVATKGFVLTGAAPVILSFSVAESGELAANRASGEELFRLPALEELTSCQGLKEKIAHALDTPIGQLRLFKNGDPMDENDPIADITEISIAVDPRQADRPQACRNLFTFEVQLALSDGKAEGCFIAHYKGEPFALLKKLTWFFKEDTTSRGIGGFHTAGDTIDIKTSIVEDRIVATGRYVTRGYKEESGPSSISGPWDCVPTGPSSKVLTESHGAKQESLAIFNLDE